MSNRKHNSLGLDSY